MAWHIFSLWMQNASCQSVSQLATYHKLFSFFFLVILKKSHPVFTHKHTTLTMLSIIMKIFQVSVLQFWNSHCQELQNLQ